MEDILASIRRIIAADHTAGSPRPGGLPFPRVSHLLPPVAEPTHKIEEPVAGATAEAAQNWEDEPVAELAVGAELAHVVPASVETVVLAPPVSLPIDLDDDPAPVHQASVHEPEPDPAVEPSVEPVYELQSSDLAVSPDKPDALISTSAGAAVSSSFQALAETVLFRDPDTVERMVREALRPMLKTWLDDNPPSMVERLVRAEIERVARGGRSRS